MEMGKTTTETLTEGYTFKIASEPWEFEQILSLNYETFVEEIPQHPANPHRILRDAFHDENTYIICTKEQQVLGMLAVRGKRPFSLDKKLENLDAYLPEGLTPCEVRLLAVKKDVRRSRIIRGLLAKTTAYCLEQGYDTALISGYLNQVPLYRHLGFVPFGPIVGSGQARFQPMYLTIEHHAAAKTSFVPQNLVPVNLLPGPVELSRTVRDALASPPISHRSKEYLQLHRQTQELLTKLVGAKSVQIMTGSGTLANETVAAQLTLLPGRGLILSNGEFGERLIHQACRFGLDFETLRLPWGNAFEDQILRQTIEQIPTLTWIWAVCCETSTGMLNDLTLLKGLAGRYRLHLCLDCISAVGNVPLDLSDVYLASACSSKGLRSAAGLALVFYNHTLTPPSRPLPAYLDLYAYEQADGVPFTIASNWVKALATALNECDYPCRFSQIASLDRWLRKKLSGSGLFPLVPEEKACPGILTLPLQKPHDSRTIGDHLKKAGFWVSYESRYLLERNWIQICLMSPVSQSRLRPLLDTLKQVL